MDHPEMRNIEEDEPEEESGHSDDEDDDSGSGSESASSGDDGDEDDKEAKPEVKFQGQCRILDSYQLHAALSKEPDGQKMQLRNLRIILRDCMADYDMILHGTLPDDPEEEAAEVKAEAEGTDPDFAAGYAGLVNGPALQPTPPPTPPDQELQQQQELNVHALLAGPGAEEFESDVDTTLTLEDQVKSLLKETRMLKIDNYMLKEVISYHLRLVNLQSGHVEQRDERNRELENEVKELKTKVNGLQDEITSMKSNQNLIGRHEQATQTTSLVYPITITARPKLKPSDNSSGRGGSGGGRAQSQAGPGGRVSGGGGAGPSGSGNGMKKLPKPKLPEPNNITHRGPPKYQYGQGQRIPFGSSSSPVKKSPSPRKVSDHENDGDDDDDDDEPEMPATRSHASNHHVNTYSRKSRAQPKLISSHRRSSASSSDSSGSESRSNPRHVGESTTAPTTSSSGRVTPTRSKGLSSPPRSPPLRHPTENSPPVRVPSPVGHGRASPVRIQSPPPARDRGQSPAKIQSPPHRQASPPVRQASPIRQPSPPRGRLSSLRRAGKDKLYFTPTRSPSKSRIQKSKQQTPKPNEPTQHASTPISRASSSQKFAVAPPPAEATTSRHSRAKSRSPSPIPRPRPNSIPISREATDSPNLFSGDNSSSSSPSNSLSKATDDEYDNLFSQFKKYRPTPIIVTSAAEAKLSAGDVSGRKAVVIKSSALLSSLRKDDYVKQSKTAMVRLDRASTATSVPAHKMRPLDYDWTIPSRPIPFINDGQKAGSSKGTANLVKTALRRKRSSPVSKEEMAKKIRMMSFSKIGKKGKVEKQLRSYIAKKYEVKKQQEVKKMVVVEEEEEEEELYDIDEYIEPCRPTPVPVFSQPKVTPTPAPPASTLSTATSRPPTKPKLDVAKPKAKASAVSATFSASTTSTTTPVKTKTKIKKTKHVSPPAAAASSRRLSTPTPARTESTESPERSPSTSPSPGQRRSRVKSYFWPLRTYTNRHEDTLMTDDPFYAMGSNGRPIGSVVEDEDDEMKILAEYDDDGMEVNVAALAIANEEEPPEQAEVPVPSWRVMKFAPAKARQLDEDMEDSVYEKRHAKWEIDERRRKRWDAQIQREEEYTRYLREREAQKAQRALKRYNRTTGASGIMEHDDTLTLLPDGKQARFILVADNLPVTAFGYAVPNMENSDFKRPWKDRNEEDVPEEEVDLIIPIRTKPRRPKRGVLPIKAPPPRKPSTSSRCHSPVPGPSSATAKADEGGTRPQGSGTQSKEVKPPRVKPPKDDMDVD